MDHGEGGGPGNPSVMRRRRGASGWRKGWILGLVLGLADARAQLPQIVLQPVFPAGAAAGSQVEVQVTAGDADEPGPLVFSDPRLTGVPKPGHPGTYLVTVPAGVPAGLVELRATGRFGISNPRAFLVEPSPSRVQPATNTHPSSAAVLERGVGLWGRLPASTRACFRLGAKAGEPLRIRVTTTELDSRLVPDLVLFDPRGREVARTRRTGLLELASPQPGEHRLELTDTQYRGGDEHFYRIEWERGPRVEFALPTGLQAGVTNRVRLFGRGLPGGQPAGFHSTDGLPLEQVEVDVAVPPDPRLPGGTWVSGSARRAGIGTIPLWGWTWNSTNGPANPVSFILGSVPGTFPGDTARVAVTSVNVPTQFTGFLPRSGEQAGIRFPARKGQVFWVEVIGERLGQPVDPAVWIQRELKAEGPEGAVRHADVLELPELDVNPGGNELPMGSRDAAGRFEVPEDGTYRVLVRDLFNVSPLSPRRPFVLVVRPAQPGFEVLAWAQSPPRANGEDRRVHLTTPTLRRGGTLPVRLGVVRTDGFDGVVEVGAEGLPAGIRAVPARIPSGASSGTLLLTAADDVAGGGFPLRLLARGGEGTGSVVRVVRSGGARWAVADFNQEPVVARMAQALHVGVVAEPEPVALEPLEDRVVEVRTGAVVNVPMRVLRRYDFPGAFNVKASGHPALEKTKEVAVAEKATNAVFELNLAGIPLPEGEHVVWWQGQVAGKYRNQPEAVATATAEFQAAEQALKAATPESRPALEDRRKKAEAARKAAEERAKPRDVTLGVWSAPIRVRVLPAK